MHVIFETILDLVFPSHCVGCSTYLPHGRLLCDSCEKKIPLHHTLFCATCNARLPYGTRVCHPTAPYLLGAAASYAEHTIRELIHRMKFARVSRASEPLAGLMVRYLRALPHPIAFDCVIPVPLGTTRERTRGFNQASLLAIQIAADFQKPLLIDSLVRTRDTAPQSELRSADERNENVAGCFAAQSERLGKHKNVLLIDDVTTSGATLREAARALRAAGARHVIAVVAAKA